MDIYDALYPPKWSIGDAMELEDLACEIEKNYGVRLNDVWHEGLSLGDLFNNVRLGCKERQ